MVLLSSTDTKDTAQFLDQKSVPGNKPRIGHVGMCGHESSATDLVGF